MNQGTDLPRYSSVYTGRVRHRRSSVANHEFSYPLYMLGLDLDEIDLIDQQSKIFSQERFNLLSFQRSDYLGDPAVDLKQAVLQQVTELGCSVESIDRVILLGQVRCLGMYFSPVNFYFCFEGNEARWMLAEVRNTPWKERHCYLVDLYDPQHSPKQFHVSPFMGLDMHYRWKVQLQESRILIHIENWNQTKLFDATLALKKSPMTSGSLASTLNQWPMMSLSILRGIYWQAFRLFIKRVPYYSHP
jgi:hypothetical protein